MPAVKRFTDAWVRNCPLPAKPNQVQFFNTLDRGLALVLAVSYGGTKAWKVVTYDAKGQPQYRKLGKYPAVKLADAKKKAEEYFHNPEKVEAADAVGSFHEEAEKWFQRHVVTKGLRSAPEIKRILATYIYPAWGSRPFVEIRRKHVIELLDHVEEQWRCSSGPSLGHRPRHRQLVWDPG